MYAETESTPTDITNDIIAFVFRFDFNSDNPMNKIIVPTIDNI